MHEPVVDPLFLFPAEASVRSRPPTEALGSSDHGPRLEDAHVEAKRSRRAWGTRRGSSELGLLPEFVTCRVDGVKGCASPPSPQRCSPSSPGVPGSGRGTFARCPPRDEAASTASRATPSAVQGDAARGAIDAAQRRMIDRRGSVVKAEPDEEFLLWRRMTTSRKCVSQPVPFRRPSRLAAAARTHF